MISQWSTCAYFMYQAHSTGLISSPTHPRRACTSCPFQSISYQPESLYAGPASVGAYASSLTDTNSNRSVGWYQSSLPSIAAAAWSPWRPNDGQIEGAEGTSGDACPPWHLRVRGHVSHWASLLPELCQSHCHRDWPCDGSGSWIIDSQSNGFEMANLCFFAWWNGGLLVGIQLHWHRV